ncbi:MAG: ROK family protein [Elusimicrobia bacterium]|nr:ROK family protein [Elusimicrobiota bacterium]
MNGIGIDIGGTNTKIIVINGYGRLLHAERFHTLGENGYGEFIKRLLDRVKRLKNIWEPVSVGIGAAGDVDPQKGLIRFSPNLEKWHNAAITCPLKKLTGLPCTLENDANMAAWGAYVLELKRKYANVLTITLGTGIGGGLILDGKLYHGATGSAGEIGHNKIQPGGERCHCGAQGCLEAYCGSYAIIRDARKAIKSPEAFVKKYAAPGRERLNTICLTRAADRGHKTALRIWRELGANLGRGLADAILLFNPDCVLLTGGVSKAWRHFIGPLKKVFEAQQIATPFQKVRLRVAKNADLGVFGAALLGMELRKK